MAEKFFLFKRKDPAISGGSLFSDSGKGISVVSIPAKSLAYMTATDGGITFFFNDVEVTSAAESVENQKSWKRISSKDVLKTFHMKKAYIQDFIFTSRTSEAKEKTA